MPIKHHDIRHFPPEYFDIIRRVALEGARLEVDTGSVQKAMKMRGSFYAFVGALKKVASDRRTVEEKDPDGSIREAAEQSNRVMVQLVGQGGLLFQNRSKSWQAEAVKAGRWTTAEEAGEALDAEMEAALQRLKDQGLVDDQGAER